MKSITEFLLSKDKKTVDNRIENVLCYPIVNTFTKFMNDYSDRVVRQRSGFKMFVMKMDEVQEYIDNKTSCLSVYEVPDEYKFIPIKDLKLKYYEEEFSLSDCKLIYDMNENFNKRLNSFMQEEQ